jgi:uncharacterized protein (DUF1330 family)
MSAYAIARVRSVEFCDDIVEYLRRIDATLEPYGGRFLVHGGKPDLVEGSWGPDAIIIQFPDREQMRAWWDSAGYREIMPLRTRHMEADIVFVDGVPAHYRAAKLVSS